MKARRGFTMIELLVSIGVIAVLLALAMPVLRSVKRSALVLAVVNHQRQTVAELERYMTDHKEFFPHYAEAGAAEAFLDYPPNDVNPDHLGTISPEDGAYWAQPLFWWWVLEMAGYDGAMARRGPEVEPGWDEMARPLSGIGLDRLTYCAFAQDALFQQGDDVLDDVSLHMPRQRSHIVFPSGKGLLMRYLYDDIDPEHSSDNDRVFVAFADGHAAHVALMDLLPGVHIIISRTGRTACFAHAAGLRGGMLRLSRVGGHGGLPHSLPYAGTGAWPATR